jgi:hypothetical protein
MHRDYRTKFLFFSSFCVKARIQENYYASVCVQLDRLGSKFLDFFFILLI